MAFSSTGLYLLTAGGLSGNAPNVWAYRTTEASTAALATGFFAGIGKGSKGSAGQGLKIGDSVIVSETTGAPNPGRTLFGTVFSSTLDQASTTSSTGFSAAFNCSIRGSS